MSDPRPVRLVDVEAIRALEAEIEAKARAQAAEQKVELTKAQPDTTLESTAFGQALKKAGWFEG